MIKYFFLVASILFVLLLNPFLARADFNIVVLPPTVTISANPTTITYPASSIITWNSQNASSCWGSSAWAGTMAPSGSVSVSPTQTTVYTINCVNTNGQQSSVSVVVTVDKPQPQPITINPTPNPQILPSVIVCSRARRSPKPGGLKMWSARAARAIAVIGRPARPIAKTSPI